MTLIAVLAALWAARSINPLRGDSAEYLYFDASRTIGYPAFLWFVRLVTGGFHLAVPIQIALLGASLLRLGWSFHRIAGSRTWTISFYAVMLIQAGMWFASAFLMTEALSTALVALWCAALLESLNLPSLRSAAMLTVIAAAATTVRPSLVALFPGTCVFIFTALPARERVRASAIAAIGFASAWGATPLAQLVVHGSTATTSPLARGVLQHTLYCDPHGVPRDPDSRFVEMNAAPVRHYIDSAPAAMREQLRREYSTPLRFGLIIPVLGRRHGLQTRSEVDPYLARIAYERVKSNPLCYARSALNEYARMAVFATDPTTADAQQINAFMALHRPVEVAQVPLLPGDARRAWQAAAELDQPPSGLNGAHSSLKVIADMPFAVLLPLRLIYAAAALAGMVSILLLAARSRLALDVQRTIPATAAMGVALHCGLAVTAIVEIGFYRYLVPFWPLVCTLCALALLPAVSPSSVLTRSPAVRRSATVVRDIGVAD